MGKWEYSVLMAVYKKDNPDYLVIAIESMLNQTVPPEEYVIVVDGPITDELKAVISKYEEKKELFTVIWLKENKGLGNALNKGLQASRNELIARMDADDISLPKRCEKELSIINEDETVDICGCNIDEFFGEPQNIKTSRIVPENEKDIRYFMRKRQAFNHPTVIFRKSKVIEAGGYEQIPRKEDFDLFSKMLVMGCHARNINESLYLYRVSSDNYKRRKSWKNLKSAFYVYWRHWRRHGCMLGDWVIVCLSEIIFFIAPYHVMRWMSDQFLRRKVRGVKVNG